MTAAPREPLSPEEAALARVYATLPGGEPPAALDARVLSQARAAVAQARRRSRPWFLMPGVGAAAAAVMAAGLAWQLGWLGDAQLPEATHAPLSESVAPATTPKPKQEEEKQRVDIDYVRQEASREVADGVTRVDAEAPAAAMRKPATPPAPPAPPPPPEPREQARAAAEFVPEPPPPVVLDDATPMSAPAPQPSAPAAESADAAAASNAQLGAAAAGSAAPFDRLERGRAAALPPWPQDAQLVPEAWLDRVRERVRLGDRQGAEFSLRRFVQTYPTRPVPAELQRLLVE